MPEWYPQPRLATRKNDRPARRGFAGRSGFGSGTGFGKISAQFLSRAIQNLFAFPVTLVNLSS
jgi:hypothetical protein